MPELDGKSSQSHHPAVLPMNVIIHLNVMDDLAKVVAGESVLRGRKKRSDHQAHECERLAIPDHGRSPSSAVSACQSVFLPEQDGAPVMPLCPWERHPPGSRP